MTARRALLPLWLVVALPVVQDVLGRAPAFHRICGTPPLSPAQMELAELLWWALWAVLLYFALPAFLTRGQLRDYGLKLPPKQHFPLYLSLYLVMLPALVYYSQDPRFQAVYPFFHHARSAPALLPVWWVAYAVMFVSLEFFFRGFVVFSLAPRLGLAALVCSAVPYCLAHYAKPLPEMLGSFPAGLALGYLALRTGSIAGGVLVHLSVAFTMDILVLLG